MIEEGRPCVDLATQLNAGERAVAEAKRVIYDHIDPAGPPRSVLQGSRSNLVTKLL